MPHSLEPETLHFLQAQELAPNQTHNITSCSARRADMAF